MIPRSYKKCPPKKFSYEWNGDLLNSKILNIFNLSLPIDDWINEEGVDEEEIKKRLIDRIKKVYKL